MTGPNMKTTVIVLSILLLVGGLVGTIYFYARANDALAPGRYDVWHNAWPLALGMGFCGDMAIVGGISVLALLLQGRFSTGKWVWFLLGGFHMLIGAFASCLLWYLAATNEDFGEGWVVSEWVWPSLLLGSNLVLLAGAVVSLICVVLAMSDSTPQTKPGKSSG